MYEGLQLPEELPEAVVERTQLPCVVAVQAAGGNALQFVGLVAPLLQVSEPIEFPGAEVPPVPEQPEPPQATHDPPI